MPKKAQPPINNYGLDWESDFRQDKIDCAVFSERMEGPQIPSREILFRQIAEFFVPGLFEWHEWTQKIVSAGCHERWIGLAGCSGSCKTFNTAGFAATWWLADPERSSVIFTSTTMKSLRKRGWAEIENYYQKLSETHGPNPYGTFVNSQTLWRSEFGGDKAAIFGMAVSEGNTAKAAANIQGIHTERQLVIIDEAPATPSAIWKAVFNLVDYPIQVGGEFILMAIGNPITRIDDYGRFIEPEDGYQSVTPDSDDWRTKAQIDGKPGICLRFDIHQSPNVLSETLVSKHLPGKKRLENWKGKENTSDYWTQQRGFPPPDGIAKTVLTESICIKFKLYDRHQFTGKNFIVGAAYDHARTGDHKALRFWVMGQTSEREYGLEFMPPIYLETDAASPDPINYQTMKLIKAHCENVDYRGQKYVCPPAHFGGDATGGGADFFDLLEREWSKDVIRVQFAGEPSTDPASNEDPRPSNEVYLNKRAEMYWLLKNAAEAGQLRGLDRETAAELCTLEIVDITKTESKVIPKKKVMPKDEYKRRFLKSPDAADTSAIAFEVARQLGFKLAAMGLTAEAEQEAVEVQKQEDEIYHNVNYSQRPEDMDDDENRTVSVWGDDD